MKLKEMTKAELELLSLCDIAALLLKENKKPMNTPALFKSICSLLDFSEAEYTDKIGQFYTSLTTDKRFVLLDSAEWDLRDNHAIKITIDDKDDDDDEVDYEEEYDEDEVEESEEENIEEPIDDEELDIDDVDDDLDDLSIVDEDEMEE